MNMKYLLKTIHIVLIAVFILHGCNSEVFINDFAPSINEVRLSEKDSVYEIGFESSNWDVKSVFFIDEEGIYHSINGNIYGHDGNLAYKDSYLHTDGLELVKLEVSHQDIKLTIERKDIKHLVLSNSENMAYETKRIYLNIGNKYNSKHIPVDIKPSSRYNLDSIVYTESHLFKDSIIQKRYASHYINSLNKVTTHDIYPYSYFKADYSFVNEHKWETVLTEEQLKIFGKDIPIVPVPVISRSGWPVKSDITLPLTADIHNLSVSDEMLKIKEEVTVSPNKQRTCTTKCWYKYYGIWFKIYASHPITGEKRTLDGLLDIYYPQSYEIEYGEETELY